MTKFEEEFNYLIELSGKVLIGQVDAEAFEKNRIEFFEKYETDQQQALPVVPECVAEIIEYAKNNKTSIRWFFTEAACVFSEAVDWYAGNIEGIVDDIYAERQCLLIDAFITGKYQVEKPQLFYLKHELTGQFLAKDNHIKDEDRYFFWTGANPLTHSVGTAWKLTFTQSEIDRIQCGLEQIEVTE
jgi:hypothetical protein